MFKDSYDLCNLLFIIYSTAISAFLLNLNSINIILFGRKSAESIRFFESSGSNSLLKLSGYCNEQIV